MIVIDKEFDDFTFLTGFYEHDEVVNSESKQLNKRIDAFRQMGNYSDAVTIAGNFSRICLE